MTKQAIVYLSGIVLIGFFYAPFKAAMGSGIWFVVAGVAYLALLRLVGYAIAKRWPDKKQNHD